MKIIKQIHSKYGYTLQFVYFDGFKLVEYKVSNRYYK